MKQLPNHLSFLLTKEDFETTYYMDIYDCGLAKAIKREGYKIGGGDAGPGVGGTEVTVNGENFYIHDHQEIPEAYINPPSEGLVVNLLKI